MNLSGTNIVISAAGDAPSVLGPLFTKHVSERLRTLFQEMHLYQSVTTEHENLSFDAIKKCLVGLDDLHKEQYYEAFYEAVQAPWVVRIPGYDFQAVRAAMLGDNNNALSFYAPDVSLFCSNNKCNRTQAFNPQSVSDVLLGGPNPSVTWSSCKGTIQIFAFSYLCQGCKRVPEIFLVRREALKLTICGKAPMEHIDVHDAIPRQIKEYYSGAILAYQSGQTLAGNFMLRVVIEQWAKYFVNDLESYADKALESYQKQLPDVFKQHFPSFPNLYTRLSDDIHRAKGSLELFEQCRADIQKHFEALRLHGIQPRSRADSMTSKPDLSGPLAEGQAS